MVRRPPRCIEKRTSESGSQEREKVSHEKASLHRGGAWQSSKLIDESLKLIVLNLAIDQKVRTETQSGGGKTPIIGILCQLLSRAMAEDPRIMEVYLGQRRRHAQLR